MSAGAGKVVDRRTRVLIWLGANLLKVLARTWRMKTVHASILHDARAQRTPLLFTLWHGQMLPILWQHRDQKIAILISEHRDGEIIAQIAQRFGCRSIRGSTSRGGSRALLALARELTEGRDAAITPDGPRGPAHRFAPGALVAAQRSGKPMILVGAHAASAWQLRSWDGFIIPKPFARVTIAYSGPVYIEAAGPREAAMRAPELETLLNSTVAAAGE